MQSCKDRIRILFRFTQIKKHIKSETFITLEGRLYLNAGGNKITGSGFIVKLTGDGGGKFRRRMRSWDEPPGRDRPASPPPASPSAL
jgi:hypothetical protein